MGDCIVILVVVRFHVGDDIFTSAVPMHMGVLATLTAYYNIL